MKIIKKKEKAKINTIKNKKEGITTDRGKFKQKQEDIINFMPINLKTYVKQKNIFKNSKVAKINPKRIRKAKLFGNHRIVKIDC